MTDVEILRRAAEALEDCYTLIHDEWCTNVPPWQEHRDDPNCHAVGDAELVANLRRLADIAEAHPGREPQPEVES